MGKKNSFLLLIFSIFSFYVFYLESLEDALDKHPHGTLIVTYQTGQKGERLDRIRFFLKSDNHAEMYPKGLNFVDDAKSMARTVVIENLQTGRYHLHFLIPNKDGFFQDVPPREIIIEEDNTLKIDQKIKPQTRLTLSE